MPKHLGQSRIGDRVDRAYSHPLLAVVLEPARDLLHSTAASKVIIVVGGAMAWVYSSAFESALVVAVCVSAWDWQSGRRAAQSNGTFCPDVARIGVHVKISTFVQLGVVRAMEAWASMHISGNVDWLPESRGWLATGLLVGFIASEMDSIDRHKIAMGGSPLWGWSRLSGFLRNRIDAMIPGGSVKVGEADLQERERDRRGNAPAPKRGKMNGTDN